MQALMKAPCNPMNLSNIKLIMQFKTAAIIFEYKTFISLLVLNKLKI